MAESKYVIRRRCPICGSIFQIRTIDAIHCSKRCSDIAYKRKKDREEKEKLYEKMAKDIPDIKEYLSVPETVAKYCIERDTLYREIRLGKIPSVNLGKRQIRLKQSDVEQRYPKRNKARKAAEKPIPKAYILEPENCYTIGEISKLFRIGETSVWTHIRKFSIPTRQIGKYVYVPKKEIDNLYKTIEV